MEPSRPVQACTLAHTLLNTMLKFQNLSYLLSYIFIVWYRSRQIFH